MNYIKRDKSVASEKQDLESLYKLTDFFCILVVFARFNLKQF